jgi:Ca2+-binding EF-hand superfamily protein|tara:strand:- start:202 stop:351 length:150 start_codon:yes stop_codon:yes gene_type:complete
MDTWEPPISDEEKKQWEQEMKDHFKTMDPDGNGFVTHEELHAEYAKWFA